MTSSGAPQSGRAEIGKAGGVLSVQDLQRGSRDMAALLALPAMWVDRSPPDIVADLLNVLFAVLRLEVGYVRFDDPLGGAGLECWRPEGSQVPLELHRAAASAERIDLDTNTAAVGEFQVTSISRAVFGEQGLVLVGSRRADFPTDLELYLLRLVVGQAAVAIHTARELAAERSAREAAEAALQVRNAFLAKLAEDLVAPLETLSERAAQATVLATDSQYVPGRLSLPLDGGGSLPPGTVPGLNPPAELTRREVEVLGLLGQGLSNKEIAGVLWLSDRTVERHVTGLYRKLGVERRSEAITFAMRYGLVDPGHA